MRIYIIHILLRIYFCRYAGKVLEVYKVNEELNKQLKDMSLYTAQFGTEAGIVSWLLHASGHGLE